MTLKKVEGAQIELWNVPRYDCSECGNSFFVDEAIDPDEQPEPILCPFCAK
jgi:hypothetical protein